MRFEKLSWFDVKKYLENDDRLIFILGACEQHAYLSLLTDIKIPLALADEASKKTGVLIAPPLNFGISPYFLSYPGTISLSVETFCSVVVEMFQSAYQQGFRRFFFLNGHGGNHPVQPKLSELINQYPNGKIRFHSWFDSGKVKDLIQTHQLKGDHASWLEAFSFNRLREMPSEEKEPVKPEKILPSDQVKQQLGDGSFGGVYQIDDQIMDELFQAALDDLLGELSFDT